MTDKTLWMEELALIIVNSSLSCNPIQLLRDAVQWEDAYLLAGLGRSEARAQAQNLVYVRVDVAARALHFPPVPPPLP